MRNMVSQWQTLKLTSHTGVYRRFDWVKTCQTLASFVFPPLQVQLVLYREKLFLINWIWHMCSNLSPSKCPLSVSPSAKQQELLLRRGAVPRLVAILIRFPDKEALEDVCLQALCNLSGMGVAEEAGMVWERGASVRPGESVFHGISPHTCGFASSVTLVRVSQWAPGQYAVNIEVFQRCSSSFWNLHGNKRTARWFPLSGLWSGSNLYKLIKFSTRNVPRRKSLKTRVFHTFLWQLKSSCKHGGLTWLAYETLK